MTDPITTFVLLVQRVAEGVFGQIGVSDEEFRLLVLGLGGLILFAVLIRLLRRSKRPTKATMTERERRQLRTVRQQRMPEELR